MSCRAPETAAESKREGELRNGVAKGLGFRDAAWVEKVRRHKRRQQRASMSRAVTGHPLGGTENAKTCQHLYAISTKYIVGITSIINITTSY